MSDTEFGTGLRAHLLQRDEVELAYEDVTAPEQESPAAEPDVDERLDVLAAVEADLAERERRLAETEAVLEAHARLLLEREAELERAAGGPRAEVEPTDVRGVLRRRAEEEVDRLWRTLDQALGANRPDGGADHATRLSALNVLFAHAYATSPVPAATVEDELARLRERKAAQRGS